MSAHRVERCEGCGSTYLQPVLSLGSSPPTCAMVAVGDHPATEEHHPLELLRCEDCDLVSLSVVVDPEIVFAPDYPYSSGNSRQLHEHFESLAATARELMAPGDLVVDIGANDGTLLSKFADDVRAVGVEPTAQAEKIQTDSYREFFSQETAAEILSFHGQAKVITACNVLAHVEDLAGVLAGIRLLLADDGVLITENHHLTSVVLGGQWDTIYHEHLRFYSPFSLFNVLRAHGFAAQSWRDIPTHGGSFQIMATKGGPVAQPPPRLLHNFDDLARKAAGARAGIRRATASGGVWGIGATARATTIINYCGLDVGDIECVCEVPGSDKIGHFIPGTRIPVVSEELLFRKRPGQAILFSWHLADAIVPKLRASGYDQEILIPLPHMRAVRPNRMAA